MIVFPKVIWGDVWIEDKKLGLFHMRACYDRAKQTIILDWQRVETLWEMFMSLQHEFKHHLVDRLRLPEWLHDLIG